jgi:hypothetical protein
MATKAKDKPAIADDLPEGVKKRMQNLKQYKKDDGNKAKQPEVEMMPIHIDVAFKEIVGEAKIPVVSEAHDPAHTIPITAKAVLNKEEYRIYINEVREWLESHPDWTLKEDLDDIYGIAMEKVIQFRLLMKRKRHPRSDIEKDYNSSVYRMQSFRQNLAARRSDRISGKNKVVNQTNIAIIASEMDAEQIDQLRARALKNQQEELEMFPDNS